MTRNISRTLVATVAACLLAFSSLGHARAIDESPSALAMAGDAVFVRPVLLATTIVGSAVYLVSLPFSLLGGNAEEAGEVWLLVRRKQPSFGAWVAPNLAGSPKQSNSPEINPPTAALPCTLSVIFRLASGRNLRQPDENFSGCFYL